MEHKKENPIAVQSKQWILDALLKLMEEKEYGKITVKELADCACLDRKTFYRNFRTKEDVLDLQLQKACLYYLEKLKNLSMLSSYAVSEAYFEVCMEHIHFFELLNKNHLLPLVLVKFNEYLPELNRIFLNQSTYRGKSQYELIYQAGGFWNVTIQWLNDGAKESPNEMAQIISSIMPSSLV